MGPPYVYLCKPPSLALLTVHKLVGSGLTYYLSLRMAGLSWYKADALATALQPGYRLAELSSQREVVELLGALQCNPGPVWLGGNSIGRQHNTLLLQLFKNESC